MPEECIAYGVFIASPDDCDIESESVYRRILEWNGRHTRMTRRVMIPVNWKHQMPPVAGKDPQLLINEELLDGCDLLAGVFKRGLGASRGAEREVRYFMEKGRARRVMLFIHRDESLRDADLRSFVDEMRTQAFYKTYENEAELAERLEEALVYRAHRSLAAPHIKLLRESLVRRIREFDAFEHSPAFLERACNVLALAGHDLIEFSRRGSGRNIGIVDTRVAELSRSIVVVTRDVVGFVNRSPWGEVNRLATDLTELIQSLPEEDQLL